MKQNKNTNGNVPNLRFPEFSGEWEYMQVSKLLDFYTTNSLSWENLEYNTAGIYNLHYGLIHKGLPVIVDMSKVKLPIVKSESIPNNYTICNNGDIAFADASEDTNDVAKAIEFTDCSNKTIICGLHTIHGRDNAKKTVVGYKGYAFASSKFHDQIRRIAQGTKVYSISSKNFAECYVGIPNKEEQQKIASLLTLIDERISTQKKIIDSLESLIKGLSHTLLTRNKEYPQVMLSELAHIIGGGTPDTNIASYWGGKHQWFTPSEVGKTKYVNSSKRYISESGLDNSGAKLLPPNSVLLSSRATIGECAINKIECATNQGFQSLVAKANSSCEFLYYSIINLKPELLKRASGSTFLEISAKEVGKILVPTPPISTQIKIVNTLSNIDMRINIAKDTLSAYQTQKEYLLREMFI
ncbi:MAG: restriction endonuclease subunit S [Rikenellaceae bacterium]